MKKKKVGWSRELAGWLFNALYWLDVQRIAKTRWKKEAFAKYQRSGMCDNFRQGVFSKTWNYIEKHGLIREGKQKIIRQKRR